MACFCCQRERGLLAAFLSAVLQGYTRQSAQAELARVFAAQYQLTLTEEVEIRRVLFRSSVVLTKMGMSMNMNIVFSM